MYIPDHTMYIDFMDICMYFTKEYSLNYFTMKTVVLSSQRRNVAVLSAFLCSPDLPRAHSALTNIHPVWGIPNQYLLEDQ